MLDESVFGVIFYSGLFICFKVVLHLLMGISLLWTTDNASEQKLIDVFAVSFATLVVMMIIPLIIFKGYKVEEAISKACLQYANKIAFVYVCSHVVLQCIARGNMLAVIALSSISVIVISGLKFVASFQVSVTVAHLIMIQLMITSMILIHQGMLVAAIITIFPVLLATFAMHIPIDKRLRRATLVADHPKND